MASAILVEGVASALSVPRRDVQQFFDGAERAFGAMKGELSRRVGAIASSQRSNAEKAEELIQFSRADIAPNEAFKGVTLAAGTLWGGLIALQGMNAAAGATVALLGVELLPAVAILIGLAILFFCGSALLSMGREVIGRLKSEYEREP